MLRLRPYKVDDYKKIINWAKDRRTFCMWCADLFKYPLTEEVLNEYKEKYDNDESGIIFVAVDKNGEPVGHFLLKDIDYDKGSGYIAFVIIDPEKRGKGYGVEMIKQAVKYGFDILNLSKLDLGVYEDNIGARMCYKKAGFKEFEYIENSFEFNDEKWNLYNMKIEK